MNKLSSTAVVAARENATGDDARNTRIARGMERLENWARWAVGGEIGMILAHYYPDRDFVCGGYQRSSEGFTAPVDELDAHAVEDALNAMPAHLCHAARFRYAGKVPVNCVYDFRRSGQKSVDALVKAVAERLGGK